MRTGWWRNGRCYTDAEYAALLEQARTAPRPRSEALNAAGFRDVRKASLTSGAAQAVFALLLAAQLVLSHPCHWR